MSTKTKTKTYADLVRDAHDAALSKAEDQRTALLDAEDAILTTRDAADDAEGDEADLDSRLDRGDETVTAADLATAKPSPADLPVAVVWQARPTEGNGDGTIRGRVTATLFHSIIHRVIDRAGLTEALSEHDVHASLVAGPSPSGAKVETDRDAVLVSKVEVNVSDAAPAVPVITKRSDYRLNGFAGGIASGIAARTVTDGRGVELDRESREYRSRKLAVKASSQVVSEDTTGTERSVVAEVNVSTRPLDDGQARDVHGTSAWLARSGMSETTHTLDVTAEVEKVRGEFVPGVGRVSSVEKTGSNSYRLTLVSRTR